MCEGITQGVNPRQEDHRGRLGSCLPLTLAGLPLTDSGQGCDLYGSS